MIFAIFVAGSVVPCHNSQCPLLTIWVNQNLLLLLRFAPMLPSWN
jgi:hypothetical protein